MSSQAFSERRYIALSVLLMFLIALVSGGMAVYLLADKDVYHAHMLTQTALEIDQLYQREVDWNRISENGLKGMLGLLDRYCGYLEPEQLERTREELSGAYVGIGVNVTTHKQGLLVMTVRENGPAAEVGLLNGDIIFEVDSTNLAGMDAETASGFLRGSEGTKTNIRVFRSTNRDTLDFEITRRKIDLVHVQFAGLTPDSAIYIRLLDFESGASDELEEALDSLLAYNSGSPNGVILDLRGNPGGLLIEAYRTANLFLESGKLIVGTDGRQSWNNEKFLSDGHDVTDGLPLAVLVDKGSASSAEIVAGALKQLDRAVLVGDTTFGKGLVQAYARIPVGGALRLTVSRYYLEGDLYLNEFDSTLNDTGCGIVPDYVVEFQEYKPFPMALERSLLLHSFASEHQDEIVAGSGQYELDDTWVMRFQEYALSEGFKYRSQSTRAAELLEEVTLWSDCVPQIQRVSERIVRTASSDDNQQLQEHSSYIKRRLKQVALERKYGTYRAYADAVVPERYDIQLAAQLLRERGR